VLNSGGLFVLEPQSWESYAKAKRMDPVQMFPGESCFCLTECRQVLKEKANNLKLRPEGFQAILEDIGFVSDQSTGPVGEGGQTILYQLFRVAHRNKQDFKDLSISIERLARNPLYSRMVTSTTPFTIFIETLPRILSAPCIGAWCISWN
jgi:hypothetical protein